MLVFAGPVNLGIKPTGCECEQPQGMLGCPVPRETQQWLSYTGDIIISIGKGKY